MRFKVGHVFINIFFMLVMFLLLCVGLNYAMNIYTRHGESIEVPNLKGMSLEKAKALLESQGLNLVVSDSVHNKKLPAGQIVEQFPKKGLLVKSGHDIFVTVNSRVAESVQIPDLIDNSSYREARAELSALGFRIDDPVMVHGEKDWVYGILCDGSHVFAGDFVPVDSRLELQIGDGVLNETVDEVVLEDAPEDYAAEEDAQKQPAEETGETDDFEVVQ